MLVLGIDTCGPEGSLALGWLTDTGFETIRQVALPGKTCSEQLLPALRGLLEESGVAAAQLGCIVVVHGPGSFTGVRVGLSTAKGLGDALSLPAIGLSRLQVLATRAGNRAAVLDAGRGEVYFGIAGQPETERVLRPEQVRDFVVEQNIACCEERWAQVFPAARHGSAPTAEDALRYAESRIRNRDYDDLDSMDAHYLRRSEAEVVAERAAGPAQ